MVTLPKTFSPTKTMGARPQAPTQRTVSMENRPSKLTSPSSIFSCCLNASTIISASLTKQAVPMQIEMGYLPRGTMVKIVQNGNQMSFFLGQRFNEGIKLLVLRLLLCETATACWFKILSFGHMVTPDLSS